MNIAVVRGKFLNKYEMQFYEPLVRDFHIVAFGSLTSYHRSFAFPVRPLVSPMDVPDVPCKMPVLNRLFTDAHYLIGLEQALRGFDIAHTAETYYRYTQQCLNAKKNGYVKRVVATVLETIPFNNEGIRGRAAYKQRARTELDHIIALTKKTMEALIAEGADPKKITVISHYIDTKRFAPGSSWKDRLGNPEKKKITVLFTGRLEEYKGVYDLLDAFESLVHDPALSQFTLRLRMVGSGSQENKLLAYERKKFLERHIVHEHAAYEDMPDVYRDADIFVAPSKPRIVMRRGKDVMTWEEQYCTALLEAQASGLPIVTTQSGGIPENVGNAGVLITPGDSRELSRAIKDLVLHPAKRIRYGRLARYRAERVHDIGIGAAKLRDLYTGLI